MFRSPHLFVCSFFSLILLAAASPAHALSTSCSTTGPSSATFTLGNSTSAACFSGVNDTNTIDNAFVLFGMSGWVLSEKNSETKGDGTIEFTTAPVNGTQAGSWTIDTLAGLSKVVITLKAGNGFGAFLLDLTVGNPLTGTWAATKDLSHSSIYYNGIAAVPLPAALPLLGGGMGLLGFAAWWRRKTATA